MSTTQGIKLDENTRQPLQALEQLRDSSPTGSCVPPLKTTYQEELTIPLYKLSRCKTSSLFSGTNEGSIWSFPKISSQQFS